jgi:hypothetical protein
VHMKAKSSCAMCRSSLRVCRGLNGQPHGVEVPYIDRGRENGHPRNVFLHGIFNDDLSIVTAMVGK